MSKKFLIVGNKPISGAIVSTLSLLNSYHFVQINPIDFPDLETLVDDLEKFKDVKDINAIIISDFLTFNEEYPIHDLFGIELIKHIRLTDSLGSLCLLSTILLSSKEIMHHLKTKRDNIILTSPSCHHIHISFCISELFNTINKLRCFESQEDMKNIISEFIVWSKEDDVISEHDNFNRYGPFKLLKEYYGDEGEMPDVLLKEYRVMTKKLWFKKYQFLETPNSPKIPNEIIDEDSFKKTIRNNKILYIDDEHRLGWSFVLYSLISDDINDEIYPIFQHSGHLIETSNGKLTCIDNYDEASKLFGDYKERFGKALSEYSKAEHTRNSLSEEYISAKKNFAEIERKYNNATENLSQLETNRQMAEKKFHDAHNKLKESMDTFADAYIQDTKNIEVAEIQSQIKGLADGYEQYEKTLNTFLKYKEDHKRNKESFEGTTKEFEGQKQILMEIESKKSATTSQYDLAIKALSKHKLFPYDLVILDLRLEKNTDRDVLPHEISGIRLLRQIKEFDPSIPVIIFTASQKAINYKEAIDMGASGYWIKAINSSSDLKSEIVKSFMNAREIRDLWLDIKKVEAKKQLTYLCENANTRNLQKDIISETIKAEIILRLKEGFLMLQKETNIYEESICNYNNYSKIALNMGLVQEERFGNIRNEKWDKFVRQNRIDEDEIKIRQTRNKAAHQIGPSVSKEEAFQVFRLTLDRCLGP